MKFNKISASTLIVLLASVLVTGNALAHALLVHSLPAANSELPQSPAKIEMWFSEPLEAGFSSARLLTTSGDEVPVGAVELGPNDPTHLVISTGQLPPGIYTVAWKTLSRTDGHEWYGSFPFTVLNSNGSRPDDTAAEREIEAQSELPTMLQTFSRWLALMGGVLFFSVPLFFKFVVPELAASEESENLKARLNVLALRIVTFSVLAVILGSWLQIALQAFRLDSLILLPRLIYGTHGGALILSRQALVLIGLLLLNGHKRRLFIAAAIYEACILLLCFVAGIQGEVVAYSALIVAGMVSVWAWRKKTVGNQNWNLFLIPGFFTLLFFSLGSHAGAVPGSFWAILSDLIHLLAASAWIGGLMLLPFVLVGIRKDSVSPDKFIFGKLFRCYGYMAKLSFFLLFFTGVFNSLVQFPTFTSIMNTSYGHALLIKLLLVFVTWEISILSSRILRQKVEPSQFLGNLQRFVQQISLAALVGLLLMVSVSVLVQTQPPVRANSQENDFSYHNVIQADDLSVHIQVTPNQAGNNQFHVQLFHADGSTIGEVQLVRLLFNYEDAQIGQADADLHQVGADVFGIEGVYLNRPGTWKLSVYVRRSGVDDVITDFLIKVPDSSEMESGANPFENPISTIPVNGIFAGSMIALAVEIVRWRGTIKQLRPGLFNVFMATACILVVVALIVGLPMIFSLISS